MSKDNESFKEQQNRVAQEAAARDAQKEAHQSRADLAVKLHNAVHDLFGATTENVKRCSGSFDDKMVADVGTAVVNAFAKVGAALSEFSKSRVLALSADRAAEPYGPNLKRINEVREMYHLPPRTSLATAAK